MAGAFCPRTGARRESGDVGLINCRHFVQTLHGLTAKLARLAAPVDGCPSVMVLKAAMSSTKITARP
ncbi:MAG TPA: hypothetical protein VGU45_14715 [Microvirga sp.]|nr:hypothetical protein [Microvirga sp.]